MQIQYQLSNGMWSDVPEHRIDEFINMAIQTESWLAPRLEREPLTTKEQVIECMESGKTVRIGSDWYDNIRIPQPPKPFIQPEMVKCSCGHTVPRVSVMSASMGTSCPECYDRMSM